MPYNADMNADAAAHGWHAAVREARPPRSADVDAEPNTSLGRPYQQGTSPKPLPSGSLPSTNKRVAVVLSSSPARRAAVFAQPKVGLSDELDELQLVTSDLEPQDRSAQRTPVKLPSVQTTPRSQPQQASTAKNEPLSTAQVATATQPPAAPPKRRGRPVGWRRGMGPYSTKDDRSDGGGPPARSVAKDAGEVKRRGRPGRPAKHKSPGQRAIYDKLRPKFIAFLCEWEGCVAELHNFETLRRHVLAVHGASKVCRWAKCTKMLPARRLATPKDLEDHVSREHLEPFVWHVGDGPRNDAEARAEAAARLAAGDNAPLPEYLFDKDGRQVTPSIRGQLVETQEERRERRQRLHRLIEERDRNAPDEEVELTPAELAELQKLFAARQS